MLLVAGSLALYSLATPLVAGVRHFMAIVRQTAGATLDVTPQSTMMEHCGNVDPFGVTHALRVHQKR